MLSRLTSAFLYCLFAGSAGPQTPLPEQLKWDVISVKPMSAGSCTGASGGIHYLPNGLSATCVPPLFLLQFT